MSKKQNHYNTAISEVFSHASVPPFAKHSVEECFLSGWRQKSWSAAWSDQSGKLGGLSTGDKGTLKKACERAWKIGSAAGKRNGNKQAA